MLKKGAVAMRKKRGKEVPVNNDRGVNHCQVGEQIKLQCCFRVYCRELISLSLMIEISCLYPRLGGFLTQESYNNCQVLFALLQLDKPGLFKFE